MENQKGLPDLNKYQTVIRIIWYVVLFIGGLGIALVTVFNVLQIFGVDTSGALGLDIDFTAPGLIMRVDSSVLKGFLTPALLSLEINILAVWALLLYSIQQILKIFIAFSTVQTPFIRENVRRMKKISFAFFVYSAVVFVTGLIMKITIHEPSGGQGVGIDASIPQWPILCGLFILAISEVFRYGLKLQQDNDSIV